YTRKVETIPPPEKTGEQGAVTKLFKKQKTSDNKSSYPEIEVDTTRKMLSKHKEIFKACMQLIEPLMQVCASTVNLGVKQDCAAIITKICYFVDKEVLKKHINTNRMVRFIVKLLSAAKRDPVVISNAM